MSNNRRSGRKNSPAEKAPRRSKAPATNREDAQPEVQLNAAELKELEARQQLGQLGAKHLVQLGVSQSEISARDKIGGDHEVMIDRKNAELRWHSHHRAARNAIANNELHGALLELQSCVKFGEQLGDYRLANAFAELGYVALKFNEFETARSFIKLAIGVRETLFGAAHPSVAIEYNNLAMTYEWDEDYGNAKPYLLRAVSILENHGKFDHANHAEPYEGLAAVYLAHGEYNKAIQTCMKALQIRDEKLGRLHPMSMKTVQLILQIHRCARNSHGAAAARNVYIQRLVEYSNSTTAQAAATSIRKALDSGDLASGNEEVDTCIGDFLKLMARR
jgi:tetratricopeptide (TPR) repeat protein